MRPTLTVLLFLALTAPASASDGVLEINQTCAVTTGCFVGDAPGFPVTITAAPARSFRLTSDLGPLGPNVTGISIDSAVGGALIDLAGFRIWGNVNCTTPPNMTCSGTGTGNGIDGGSDITVRNGTIRGMGHRGVSLSYSGRAQDLHLFHNAAEGVYAENESIISGVIATSNGGIGIACLQGCLVEGNTATANADSGVNTAHGSIIRNNVLRNNGSHGVTAAAHSRVVDNTIVGNHLVGVEALDGTIVDSNVIANNGAFGIVFQSGPNGTYRGNVIHGNVSSPVIPPATINLGGNHCAGAGTISSSCP